jgi:hypothetical protein
MSLFDSPLTAGSCPGGALADTRFTTAVAAAARRREDDTPGQVQDPAP